MSMVTTAYAPGRMRKRVICVGNCVEQRPRQASSVSLPRIRRADGSPIRVLLVDDEPALTDLVKMPLHYEGWTVEVAHDGREPGGSSTNSGRRAGPRHHAPDVDGLQILQQIRESEPYTPTLFLTARDSVMDRVTGLTAGANDLDITKPFSFEEFVARLRGLLRRSNQHAPPAEESLK